MGAAGDQVLCGAHAVLAALQHRPQAIRRLHFAAGWLPQLGPQLKDLAARKVAYRETPDEELEKICGSRAHQGLVAVARAPARKLADKRSMQTWALLPGVYVALDGTANPHNLGAIARTCAFLGVRGLLVGGPDGKVIDSAAAARTAEGGLESLEVVLTQELPQAVSAFARAGGLAAAMDMRGAVPLHEWHPPAGQAVLLVAGEERNGVSAAVRQACNLALRIDGSGAVESLNVGAALAIALAKATGKA